MMLGNHETMSKRPRAGRRDAPRVGTADRDRCASLEMPGLRVVLVETAIEGRGPRSRGPDARRAAVDAVGRDRVPCLVVLHHHIQRLPVPLFWPPGIGSRSGNRFVDGCDEPTRRCS